MINPNLNIDKAFKDNETKCMKTKFVVITPPHISKILAKKNKSVHIINVLWDKKKT